MLSCHLPPHGHLEHTFTVLTTHTSPHPPPARPPCATQAKKAKADAHNKKKAKGGKDEGLDDLLNAGLSSGAKKKKAGKK